MKKYFIVFLIFISSQTFAQKIYWTDGSSGKLQEHNIDGSGTTTDILTGIASGYALDVDLDANELYWTDFSAATIKKINLTSLIVTPILSSADGLGGPRGIAIDANHNRIFWADNATKKIQRSTLTGDSIVDIVTTGLVSPGYIAYAMQSGKLYFADNGVGMKKIMRCNVDGTGLEEVVTGLNQVWGIAFNFLDNNIYWVDSGIDKIQKGNVSTLPVTKTDVVTGLTGNPRGIVINAAGSLIYWTDNATQDISRATTSGGSVTQLFSGIPYPQGVAINWDSALPVELLSFASVVNRNSVRLVWSTESETDNRGFSVERKSAAEEFKEISFVNGMGTSNNSHNYSFEDVNLQAGSYTYRLKQTDFNGNFKYYQLANEVKVGVPKKFSLSQNYPNPFNPVTSIEFEIPENAFVELKVFDIAGREVAQILNQSLNAGYYKYNFNAASFSSGSYFYRIKANNFTSLKKMIVVK
jgi:sugar lactone lactonase YvrE